MVFLACSLSMSATSLPTLLSPFWLLTYRRLGPAALLVLVAIQSPRRLISEPPFGYKDLSYLLLKGATWRLPNRQPSFFGKHPEMHFHTNSWPEPPRELNLPTFI